MFKRNDYIILIILQSHCYQYLLVMLNFDKFYYLPESKVFLIDIITASVFVFSLINEKNGSLTIKINTLYKDTIT